MTANGHGGSVQYHIGASVLARDGVVGTIQRVVVDPTAGRVVDLVVGLSGFGSWREVVLPVNRVHYSGDDGTEVDLSIEEIQALPDFEDVRFRTPEVGWRGLPEYTPDVVLFWAPRTAVEAFVPHNVVPEPNVEGVRNIPEGTVSISADLDVTCGDVVVGHVDRVLVDDEADRATHLIVRGGVLSPEEHLVPVSHVRSVTETAVELDCHGRRLGEFPKYRG